MEWKRWIRKHSHCRSKLQYLIQAWVCVCVWMDGVRSAGRTERLEGRKMFSRNVFIFITMLKEGLLKGWWPNYLVQFWTCWVEGTNESFRWTDIEAWRLELGCFLSSTKTRVQARGGVGKINRTVGRNRSPRIGRGGFQHVPVRMSKKKQGRNRPIVTAREAREAHSTARSEGGSWDVVNDRVLMNFWGTVSF